MVRQNTAHKKQQLGFNKLQIENIATHRKLIHITSKNKYYYY